MRKLTIRKHGESRKVEEVPAPKPQDYTRVSFDLRAEFMRVGVGRI